MDFWKGRSDSFAHGVACSFKRVWGGFRVHGLKCRPVSVVSVCALSTPPWAPSRLRWVAHLLSICGALRSLIWVTFRRRVPCWISANNALRPFRSVFLKLGASVLTCKGIVIWRSSDTQHLQRNKTSPSAARLSYRSSAASASSPKPSTPIPLCTVLCHAHTSLPGTLNRLSFRWSIPGHLDHKVLMVSRSPKSHPLHTPGLPVLHPRPAHRF